MNLRYQSEDNFQDAALIRSQVFIEEQGFHHEFDDLDKSATHITLWVDEQLAGCLRYLIEDDTAILGRIAILPEFRHQKLGSRLVQEAEKMILHRHSIHQFKLHAQYNAQPFYEQLGYHAIWEIELDEHVEHIWMVKSVQTD